MDALTRCDNDPAVIASVACLFWADRKTDKARSWFARALTLNPDIGDTWALAYKFECQHGSEAQQAALLERCRTAEPHHGERWQRVAKAPEAAHQPVDWILRRVVADLDREEREKVDREGAAMASGTGGGGGAAGPSG